MYAIETSGVTSGSFWRNIQHLVRLRTDRPPDFIRQISCGYPVARFKRLQARAILTVYSRERHIIALRHA